MARQVVPGASSSSSCTSFAHLWYAPHHGQLGNIIWGAILKYPGEEEIIEAALKIISQAAGEANQSMQRSIQKMDKLHAQLSRGEPA